MLGIIYTDEEDYHTQDEKHKLGANDSSVIEAMVSA